MRERHYRWEWKLRSSPAALWPLVADTNRFNRDAGIGALEERGAAGPNARRRLRLSFFGIGIEWEKTPPLEASLRGLEDERVGIFRLTAPAEVCVDA